MFIIIIPSGDFFNVEMEEGGDCTKVFSSYAKADKYAKENCQEYKILEWGSVPCKKRAQ